MLALNLATLTSDCRRPLAEPEASHRLIKAVAGLVSLLCAKLLLPVLGQEISGYRECSRHASRAFLPLTLVQAQNVAFY
jgi:hypothetical protein